MPPGSEFVQRVWHCLLRKSVVVFTHADLLDSGDLATTSAGGGRGGLGGSQEHDAAAAVASAAAVNKLTSDHRLAGFLQGASEEVRGGIRRGTRRIRIMKRVGIRSCPVPKYSYFGF